MSLEGLTRILETRAQSTLALLTDVFLKRIRNLGTKVIKGIPELSPLVAFDYINDIDHKTNRPKLWRYDAKLKPTPRMSEISEIATAYPTNLWFDTDGENLNAVIMTGQMNTCLSILRHLWDKWDNDIDSGLCLPRPDSPNSEFYDLYVTAKDIWLKYKTKTQISTDRMIRPRI